MTDINMSLIYYFRRGQRISEVDVKVMTEENSRQTASEEQEEERCCLVSALMLILLMVPFQWLQKGHTHPFIKLVMMGGRERERKEYNTENQNH